MRPRLLLELVVTAFFVSVVIIGALIVVRLIGPFFGFNFAYPDVLVDLESILFSWYDEFSQYFYSAQEALWLVLIALFGVLSLGVLQFRFLKVSPSEKIQDNPVAGKGIQRAVRILCIAAGGFVAGYQHFATSLPVGADTLDYIYDVNLVLHNGLQWAFKYTDTPLLVLLSTFVKEISGLPTAQALGLVDSLLAVLLGIAVWKYCGCLFAGRRYGDEITTLAIFFSAFSPTILRSTIDLYASFLGQVLLLFSLYLVIRLPQSKGRSGVLLASTAFVLLLLSYWEFWILAIVMAILCSQPRLTGISRLTWVLIPSLVIFAGLLVYSVLFPPPAYFGIGRSVLLYFGSTSVPSFTGVTTSPPILSQLSAFPQGPYLRMLFGEGNVFVGLLALVGLVFVDPRDTKLRSLYLMSFLFCLGVLSISYGAHASLAYPSPLLAAIGLVGIINSWDSFRRQPRGRVA